MNVQNEKCVLRRRENQPGTCTHLHSSTNSWLTLRSKCNTFDWLISWRQKFWKTDNRQPFLWRSLAPPPICLWAVQWSWFARVNALCHPSHKKSLPPGRFLSRRCFTLCITMEVEPRVRKQYKWHHCCSCRNYRGMEGGKKVSLPWFFFFFGWPEDREFVEKMRFGVSYSTSNKLLLVARHILTTDLQKCL